MYKRQPESVAGEEADDEPGEEWEPGSEEEKMEETQLAISDKLRMWYQGVHKIVYDEVVPLCKDVIEQDKPLSVKIGLVPVRITVAIAKAALTDPAIVLGCVLGALANDFEFHAGSLLENSLRTGANSFIRTISLGWIQLDQAPYDMWAHALTTAHGGLTGAKLGLRTTILVRSFKKFIQQLRDGAQETLDVPEPEKVRKIGQVVREIGEHKRGESDPPTDAEMDQALKAAGYEYTKAQQIKTRYNRLRALQTSGIPLQTCRSQKEKV